MLIAQITDTHITRPGRLASGRVDTARMLQDCVAAVNALTVPPDLILLTGDLVDSGHPEEYARLQALLEPLSTRKILCVPGNHDERQALCAAFPGQPPLLPGGFMQYTHDEGPLRFVGLDTLVPGKPHGELCGARLAWLEQALAAEPTRPTLVFMHHPPFITGIGFMDAMGLTGREAFAAVVAQHPQVQLIVCGHLHRPIHAMVGGHRALTCPSPAHQILLDLQVGGPEGFVMEPAGFMLHHWNGAGVVTHTVVVGPYAGPFAF